MHAIPTNNASALSHPMAENGSSISEATTPNKRYQHPEQHRLEGHSTNIQIPPSAMMNRGSFSVQRNVLGNHSISRSTQSQNHPQAKRHCTESFWNTTRQAQPTNEIRMIMAQNQPNAHLQSSFARKRAFRHEDGPSQCTSQHQYPCSIIRPDMVKKGRRHVVNDAKVTETSMECDKEAAEEVWNFIGIG